MQPLVDLRAAIALGLGRIRGGGSTALGFPLLGRLTEPGIQGGMVPLPERHEVVPELRQPVLQLWGEGLVEIDHPINGPEPRLLFAIELRQPPAQGLGREAALTQRLELIRRQAEQLLLPEVLHHLGLERGGVGVQLGLHRRSVAEGQTAQTATAKAMDGGDVSPVQLLQGHQQAPNPPLTRLPWLGTRQPLRQDGVWSGSLHPLLQLLETLQRLLQPLADAGAQLFGRRIGEGHHQQRFEGVVGLRDQPQAEMRQSKGFAGASAGLKQADPRAEGVGVGIEALGHGWSLLNFGLKTSVNFHEAAGESCELDWVLSHPRTEDDLSGGLKNPRFFMGL